MIDDDDEGPEWTAETFARSKSFAETFPDLARKFRAEQEGAAGTPNASQNSRDEPGMPANGRPVER